jgi:hypothetical protein
MYHMKPAAPEGSDAPQGSGPPAPAPGVGRGQGRGSRSPNGFAQSEVTPIVSFQASRRDHPCPISCTAETSKRGVCHALAQAQRSTGLHRCRRFPRRDRRIHAPPVVTRSSSIPNAETIACGSQDPRKPGLSVGVGRPTWPCRRTLLLVVADSRALGSASSPIVRVEVGVGVQQCAGGAPRRPGTIRDGVVASSRRFCRRPATATGVAGLSLRAAERCSRDAR